MFCNNSTFALNETIGDVCFGNKGLPDWHHCVYSVFAPAAIAIDKFVSPFLYCFGIIGNIIAFIIWNRLKVKRVSSWTLYLRVLAVTDTMLILLHIIMELEYAWGQATLQYPIWCTVFFVLFYFAQYMSPLLVFGFSCERSISIIKPFKSARFSKHGRIWKEIIIIIFVAMFISLGQIAGWAFDKEEGEFKSLDADFYRMWSYVTEIVIFIIIPLLTLICNLLLMKRAKHSIAKQASYQSNRQNGSSRSLATRTLIAVTFYRIVATLSTSVIYMLQYHLFPHGNMCMSTSDIEKDPVWKQHFIWLTLKKIIDEIGLSQYSINIVISVIKERRFRLELVKIIPVMGKLMRVESKSSTSVSMHLLQSSQRTKECLSTR